MVLSKREKKNLQGVIGVILVVLGFAGSIPLVLRNMFGPAVVTFAMVIVGIILIAMALSD